MWELMGRSLVHLWGVESPTVEGRTGPRERMATRLAMKWADCSDDMDMDRLSGTM